MTVFQISGDTATFSNDGSAQTGNLVVENCVNQITGGRGPVTVKITNTSTANVAQIQWIREDTTYSFTNVVSETLSSGTGATFDVVASYGGDYAVTIDNIGADYAALDTVTIYGNVVGGSDTTNDITVTVGNVDVDGGILDFTFTGTSAWPQGTSQTYFIAPMTTEFVQINSSAANTQFTTTCGDGNVYIAPVTVL